MKSMEEFKNIKEQLYSLCLAYAEQRIHTATEAIATAQDAANMETKSSAGDKYETTRSMMQLEKERSAGQLQEAMKLKKALAQINIARTCDAAQLGALVITDREYYFIAISMGKVQLQQQEYLIIAPGSPLGQALQQHQAGDEVLFNHRRLVIKMVL